MTINTDDSDGVAPTLGGASLAVIIPTYCEEAALPHLFQAFDAIAGKFDALGIEPILMFVDDNSPDGTQHIICARMKTHPNTRLFVKQGERGKDASIMAVLPHVTQDAFSVVDADLQDPLDVLVDMSRQWLANPEQAVRGQRSKRNESAPKVATARAFYAISNKIGLDMPPNVGDFGVYPQVKAQEITERFSHSRPFLKAAFAATCPDAVLVPYIRPERAAGETSWSYGRLFKYATSNMLAHSTLPATISLGSGIGLSVALPTAAYIGGKRGAALAVSATIVTTGATVATSALVSREHRQNLQREVPTAVEVTEPLVQIESQGRSL